MIACARCSSYLQLLKVRILYHDALTIYTSYYNKSCYVIYVINEYRKFILCCIGLGYNIIANTRKYFYVHGVTAMVAKPEPKVHG